MNSSPLKSRCLHLRPGNRKGGQLFIRKRNLTYLVIQTGIDVSHQDCHIALFATPGGLCDRYRLP
ncbi:hypothetical protein GGR01_000838 [Acetobacter oeni]|nr:hypothetical protein [Acetobacter oeni]